MDDGPWALLYPVTGAGSLALILALTLPALHQLWIKARFARRSRGAEGDGGYEVLPQLFESPDGQATAESMAAFSDWTPRLVAWISVFVSLVASVVSAVLLSMGPAAPPSSAGLYLVNTWADVPAWGSVLLQCASIPTKSQFDRRYLLATIGFWSCTILLSSILVRRGFDIVSTANSGGSSLAIGTAVCWAVELLGALTAALAFASFPHRPDVYYQGGVVDRQNAASMLSQLAYSWNRVVFQIAHERKLELEDLPNLDSSNRSSNVCERYISNGGSAGGKNGRLWWQLVKAYRAPLMMQWVLTLVRSLLSMFPQYVLYHFLEGLDRHQRGNQSEVHRLWGWVVALSVSLVLQVIANSRHRWLTSSRLEVPVSSLIQALIFRKALHLDEAAEPGTKTVGGDSKDGEKEVKKTSGDVRQSVVNHMKLDSGRMMIFCTYNYWIPLAGFKLVLAGAALVRLLGWRAILSGVSCAVVIYPISQFLSKRYASIQFGLMKYRDGKSHILTEALQGMRQIKYSALEKLYERKIIESRNEELRQFWRVAKWMFGLSLVVSTGPILLSCVSLAVYTITTPTHVRASVIFTSLGLFDHLDEAFGYLPLIQVYLMEAWISCVRIEKYLNQPDKAPIAVPGEDIVFEKATVRWPRAEDAHITADAETASSELPVEDESAPSEQEELRSTLRNANLRFPSRELSLVTGKTGSGKSLLLAAILGEVRLLSGTIHVPKAPSVSVIESKNVTDADWILPSLTAFVSQTPWIEGGSFRENILFGMPFRESRYNKVLRACALEKDIELLIDGDATEVGPKGVTLSGGQRWRVALARALYSRAGILILDDVLSAVDAHVGRTIVNEALSGDLAKGRTRILATHHGEMCLAHASYLVKLDGGRVKDVEIIERVPEPPSSAPAESTAVEEDSQQTDESVDTPKKQKLDAEERETGHVKYRVYREYIRASNSRYLWYIIFVLVIINRLFGVATTWSLKELAGSYPANASDSSASSVSLYSHKFVSQAAEPELLWQAARVPSPVAAFSPQHTPEDDEGYRKTALFWLSVYIVFEVCSLLLNANTTLLIMYTGLRASRVLFERMTHSILHAPLRWIDTVPTGRILNRFTSDTYIVDRRLANDLGIFLSYTIVLVVIIATSISVSPYILIFGALLMIVYGRIAIYYIAAAREAKRINSLAYSPVYDQFSSVLTGLSTIRAFKRTDFYMNRMFGLIDDGTKATWAIQLLGRWMNFRMGMFGAVFVTVVAICIVFGGISASLAGFGLTFALRYTNALARLLGYSTSIELGFNAAERILDYIDIDTETETGLDAPAAWPTQGHIEVENVTVSYAPDLPPVLKQLNFEVRPGERIGVVGRTGAGKSTLAAVLFRLLNLKEGCIRIDGLDISTLKLEQLRSRLAIIPQDPFLFAGTLRSNLDLDGSLEDYDLLQVLRRVHLVESEGEDTVAEATTGPAEASSSHVSVHAVEGHVEEEVVRLLESTATDAVGVSEVGEVAEEVVEAEEAAAAAVVSTPNVVVSESATEVASLVPEADSGDETANNEASGTEDDEENESGSGMTKKQNREAQDVKDAFRDLDMPVSTGGGNLSQGQRQLVCLARALLTRPKIVVLDEATSAVDRGTDSAIQESLRREFAAGGCSVLVIAHRLSTVVDFDRILVLREGRVAEMGTPRELMEKGMALEAGETTESDGSGAFWELVQRSAEKEKLLELVFGKAK